MFFFTSVNNRFQAASKEGKTLKPRLLSLLYFRSAKNFKDNHSSFTCQKCKKSGNTISHIKILNWNMTKNIFLGKTIPDLVDDWVVIFLGSMLVELVG